MRLDGFAREREVDVLAVLERARVVPLVAEFGAVFHRFAVSLKLSQVADFALDQTQVDGHLDRVQGTAHERQEDGGDAGDADEETEGPHLDGAGVFGGEQVVGKRRRGRRERRQGGGGNQGFFLDRFLDVWKARTERENRKYRVSFSCAREKEKEKKREIRERKSARSSRKHARLKENALSLAHTLLTDRYGQKREQESKKNKIESSKRERTIVCLETALTWTCGNQRERERGKRERVSNRERTSAEEGKRKEKRGRNTNSTISPEKERERPSFSRVFFLAERRRQNEDDDAHRLTSLNLLLRFVRSQRCRLAARAEGGRLDGKHILFVLVYYVLSL